jgi:alpha-beta hydrolase superfamily lysophospholipase
VVAAAQRTRITTVEADDGVRLAVRYHGLEGRGVPVILLHGMQSHSLWFAQCMDAVAQAGHPVYAPDRRGSGRSDGKRGHCKDFDQLLQDIDRLVARINDETGVSFIHVVGHCFGAVPAALWATQHADRVRSLVLATPAIYTRVRPGPGQILRILLSICGDGLSRFPLPFSATMMTDDPACLEFIRRDELALRDVTAALLFETRRARGAINRQSGLLTMPMFVALAGRDTICNLRRIRTFFGAVPARIKQLIEYSQARHILEFSPERDRFFADLRRWLERFEPGDTPEFPKPTGRLS